jgi:hypothetical protein
MKNSELVRFSGSNRLLSDVDSQRRHVLLSLLDQQPCPNCGRHSSVVDASGVKALDDFEPSDYTDYGRGEVAHIGQHNEVLKPATLEEPFRCYNCLRRLKRVVPFIKVTAGGWQWQLVPETDEEIAERRSLIAEKLGREEARREEVRGE